jgi:hypothetical protein
MCSELTLNFEDDAGLHLEPVKYDLALLAADE